MAVTPGSNTKLNAIKGVQKILIMSADEAADTALQDKVFQAGYIIKRDTGALILTDGVTALKDLKPIVDQPITAYEKAALSATFNDAGVYVPTAGGFVVHNAEGKINQESLDFMQDGKIKLENLPDSARSSMVYCANYAAMVTAATDETKKGLFFVIDATDDPSGDVEAGAAMYVWDTTLVGTGTAEAPAGDFLKIAEHESLDISITYTDVEAAGAVMYDHMVDISMTLTELNTILTPPAPAP